MPANFDRLAPAPCPGVARWRGSSADLAVRLLPGVAAQAKKKKKICVDGQTGAPTAAPAGRSSPAGQACCAGTCVNTRDAAANCGACGNVCTCPRPAAVAARQAPAAAHPRPVRLKRRTAAPSRMAAATHSIVGNAPGTRQTCGGGGTPACAAVWPTGWSSPTKAVTLPAAAEIVAMSLREYRSAPAAAADRGRGPQWQS